tara:strand:+ start:383 stop:1117 length:735 start_codon:yes stop_codon:yes gene_type:complete
MPKIIILIPARYESSRFYGKPLAMINGKEMLIRVLERSTFKYEVYAVINNNLIGEVVKRNGFKYIMVEEDCKTGTDRIGLALDKISINEDDILINVQGDEPMVSPWMIEKVIDMKKRFPDSVVNAFSSINSEKEFESKASIKMIINKNSDLLYASRSTIPSTKKTNNFSLAVKQVCIYAFSPKHLRTFIDTERGKIECSEDIEILRFIENSICSVKMVDLGNINLKAVDYKEDILLVEKLLDEE